LLVDTSELDQAIITIDGDDSDFISHYSLTGAAALTATTTVRMVCSTGQDGVDANHHRLLAIAVTNLH
jgi:hypothetical protein